MKKNYLLILNVFLLTFVACGGTPVGEGPGFPEDLTAPAIWSDISNDLYAPDGSMQGEGLISGTFDCADGGSAIVEYSKDGNIEDIKLTYSDCRALEFIDGTNYDLTRNGTVAIYTNATSPTIGESTYNQHISYSGELGFAADCNYSVEGNTSGIHYDGKCSYTDSEGKTLVIHGDEMLTARDSD